MIGDAVPGTNDLVRATVGNGVMIGIAADSRDQVDRVYERALELGGTDEGAPVFGLKAATASTQRTSVL